MSSMNKLAKELKGLLDEADARKPKAYSTTAEVTRVEDDTIWVHIPGGIEETPVRKTINASRGDVVKVNIENGGAWVIGNVSAPPTDDAKANKAFTVGENAFTKATEAEKEALRAGEAANEAEKEALRAGEAADRAETEAIRAGEAADRAETEANRAYKEAEKATGYANDSLSQLGIVEDVVGTLNWITTHATYKATDDTEVHAGKWYFTKSGDTYNVVTNPTGNPSAKGYYEVDTIDEAVSNYVASHLALTNEGLYLTKDGNGYKILLANDGLKVYDPEGHLVSTFGESIIFDSARPQTIGNNNVYIKYYDKNNDGTPDSLAIKADEFLLSSGKTIQEEIEAVENWFYSVAPTTSNPPASSWTTDKLKEQHLRDIYFDTTSGKSYRWAKEGTTYKWVEIEDVELAALAKDLHDNYPPRSEFTVAPDKIQSEVSKKVGNSEVISKINQSAETVKIQANKVEIDGTATFNAIKASADAAYDAKGAASAAETAAKAAIPTKVSQLTNDSGYQNATQVSNAVTTGVSGKADKTAAVAEEQYIYISKASGTTSVNGTTSWVTESGDKQNTWTTKRPTYNSSYPVLFVAKQKKVVSGTVTCTTPVKDDTTTVIDGGHITTGTIDSNRLNADTIKVNAANVKGTLTIGQLPSTVAETSDIPTKVSELTNDSGYQTSSQVSTAINNVRSWYATCSTAAGTAAKVATITPTTTAFTTSILTPGTLVNVKFTVTNTAAVANLTLNVNGTGAKPIKTIRYGVLNNIAVVGYLAAGVTYQFTYDGTNWVMQENHNSDTINRTRWHNVIAAAEVITAARIICGTSSGYRNIAANVSFDMAYPLLYAGTAIAKGATTGTRDDNYLEINGVNASNNGTITSGATNKVLFLKGTLTNNTFKIAASPFMTTVVPTSQDNFHYIPLGIMYSATNIYFRSSDQIYMYKDGAFGPVSVREASAAAKTATSYITNIGSDGIRVHPASTENNSVLINSDGMTVYKGGTEDTNSVAFYGDTARIGKKASRHVEIKTGGMQVYNGASSMVTHIGYESVQGESGPVMGAFFTFGKRKLNQTKGEYSVAEGMETTASGFRSHAEGYNTTASGMDSHAEGEHAEAIGMGSHAEGAYTTASGWDSHAEGAYTTASGRDSHAEGAYTTASGYYSHAEGHDTTASSYNSHAEGCGTTASGVCSHAGGGYTHASRSYQTVIGKYNKILSGDGTTDSPYVSTDAAFIIGGGTARTISDSKDIFNVTWDGNVKLAINSSATGSSVDGQIMDSLRSLGWDASTEGVIV